jgi:asparagine synthase (glutamine-hydrolysing)
MCGITGIVDLKNRRVDESVIKRMTASIAHRGPNGEGYYTHGRVGFGHRRLSILDVSRAGAQPMVSDDGAISITFNGEIYNYLELKKILKGRAYRTGTDTEVLLRAYEAWGEECLERVNGIFSFAIHDKKKDIVLMARDRLGVKPFYYAVQNDRFYFASEIKALLAAGIPSRPNDRVIGEYLLYGLYDHSDETFFDGIFVLSPGHSLKISQGKIQKNRYWHLPEKVSDMSSRTEASSIEEFSHLVKDAVRLQLRSDVPVGMSVSGGLDSSLLAGAVHEVLGGQKNFSLYHFTYDSKKYDPEIPYVKNLAHALGWRNPEVVSVADTDVRSLAEKVMWHEEQPFPGVPTFAWHKLYAHLSQTPTIVTLEGHGGDEFAGGYDYYLGPFLADLAYKGDEKRVIEELRAIQHIRKIPRSAALKLALNGVAAYARGGVSADGTRLAVPEALSRSVRESAFPRFEEPFDSMLSNFQYRELMHTKLPRVLRSVDRESMAFGRELRVPLLDHRIVEYAFSLPIHLRIHGGQQRFFMRKAAEKILGSHIAKKPKRSLPNPQRAWFQKELQPWIRSFLTSPSFRSRKYFDHREIVRYFDHYAKTPHPQNAFAIWQWVSIELWFRTFID